jgi:nicotinamidase-related amidase
MKLHLMIIDPEWDFCWPGLGHFFDLTGKEWKAIEPLLRVGLGPMLDLLVNPGKLYVPGAWEAMERQAAMVDRLRDKIDDITVTLDAHQIVDQAHPIWWKEQGSGKRPDPFTLLGLVGNVVQSLDPTQGMAGTGVEYTTYLPSLFDQGGATGKGSRGYLAALDARGRQKHVIWPVHCEIGALGSIIVPQLMAALQRWQETFATVNFLTKGSNIFTEHYGAIEAEVPDPNDESTQVRTKTVAALAEADIIAWGGIASTHCLATTFRGVVENFADPRYVQKMVLLTDATAPVPGFEFLYDAFVAEMVPKGMKQDTTINFLT